jgi:hypothetical protein
MKELRKPRTSGSQFQGTQPALTVAAPINAPKSGVFTGGDKPISRGSVPKSAARKSRKGQRSKKY